MIGLIRYQVLVFFALIGISADEIHAQITTTYAYTGDVQTYTVPSCVYALDVVIKGAKGGGVNGGNGSTVSGLMDVVEGQVLEIYIGGTGGCPNAGYNGGGIGGEASTNSNDGCGGGGGSDIRVAPYEIANRFAVAAGGGGMGGGNTDANAGNGGCATGLNGDSPFGQGGTGGGSTTGGGGGPPWIGSGNYGSNGLLATGGAGAIDPCYDVGPGGGGGGGRYGGGGGGSDCFASGSLGGGGGGGGSSLSPAGFTCTPGNNGTQGSMTITPVGGLALQVTPANLVYCEGDSVLLTITGADVYSWLPEPTLDTLEGPSVWATPQETQTYTVVASTEECLDSLDITVTIVPYPVLTFTPSEISVCNESVTITTTGADDYAWEQVETLSNWYGPTVTATPTATTTYNVTATTQGCSTDTSITVAYQVFVESTEHFCEDGFYELPDGTSVNEEGVYTAMYTSIEGCDSIVTVNLVEQSTYDFSMPVQLCAGEPFTLPDGSIVYEPGSYPVIMPTALAQCDSSITTVISILQPSNQEFNLALCDGEPAELPDGTTVLEAGTYTTILTSAITGCDSTIVTQVSVQPSYNMVEAIDACNDGSYLFPDGTIPTSSGSFDFALQSSMGCDSNIVVNLNLSIAYDIMYPAEICAGETFSMPDGTNVTAAGDYESLLQTIAGCDSIITVQLVVLPLPDVELGAAESYCYYEGDIILNPTPESGTLVGDLLNGNTLEHSNATPGNYEVSFSYTDNNGCTGTEVQPYILAAPMDPSFEFQLLCNELHLTSTISDPNNDHEYAWFLEGEAIALFASSTYAFNQTGMFDLGLSVTDIYGCTYSTEESVNLQNEVDLDGFFIPNVITPNGDDSNDRFIIPDQVAACLNYSISIYNRWGDLVYKMTPETAEFAGRHTDGGVLPDGVYYYTLEIQQLPCLESPGLQEWCSGSISIFRN